MYLSLYLKCRLTLRQFRGLNLGFRNVSPSFRLLLFPGASPELEKVSKRKKSLAAKLFHSITNKILNKNHNEKRNSKNEIKNKKIFASICNLKTTKKESFRLQKP